MLPLLDLTSTHVTMHRTAGTENAVNATSDASCACTCYPLVMVDTSDGHVRGTADLHISLVPISLTIGIKILKIFS